MTAVTTGDVLRAACEPVGRIWWCNALKILCTLLCTWRGFRADWRPIWSD